MVAPKPTQPSIPPGSVNEVQLRLEAKAGMVQSVQGETRGRQVKLCDPLKMRVIRERFCNGVGADA